MSATAAESTAVMCMHEHVTTMATYVQFVQDGRDDGVPVSGDALTVMRKGTSAQRQHRRKRAALLRMQEL